MKQITDKEYTEYINLSAENAALHMNHSRLVVSEYFLKQEINKLKNDKDILTIENHYLRGDIKKLESQLMDYLHSDMRMENAKDNLKKSREGIFGRKDNEVIAESEICVYCEDRKVRHYKIGETYALGLDYFYISAFAMRDGICCMIDNRKATRFCPASEFYKEFPTKINLCY